MDGLLSEIREEVAEFPALPTDHLKMVHRAMFSPFDREKEYYEPKVSEPRPKPKAIDAKDTPKEILRLIKVCERAGAIAMWMRTGLSVKVRNAEGYELNVANYVSVRKRGGVMNGLLTFNQVRMQRQVEELGMDVEEVEYLRGYLCMRAMSVEDVEALMMKHMKVLVRQGHDALEAKKAKAKSMKTRLK